MSSAVGYLIQQARVSRRPKWSQQFLADELCRVGYETTREQIARMERSEPCRVNAELLSAAAMALQIDEPTLQAAILADYDAIAESLVVRFPTSPRMVRDEIPTRVPQAMARRTFA